MTIVVYAVIALILIGLSITLIQFGFSMGWRRAYDELETILDIMSAPKIVNTNDLTADSKRTFDKAFLPNVKCATPDVIPAASFVAALVAVALLAMVILTRRLFNAKLRR